MRLCGKGVRYAAFSSSVLEEQISNLLIIFIPGKRATFLTRSVPHPDAVKRVNHLDNTVNYIP